MGKNHFFVRLGYAQKNAECKEGERKSPKSIKGVCCRNIGKVFGKEKKGNPQKSGG